MERLTSRSNPFLQGLERLAKNTSERNEQGLYLCEGEKLLMEALAAGVEVTAAVWDEELTPQGVYPSIPKQVVVPHSLYERVSTLKNVRSVLFCCRIPQETGYVPRRGQVLCLDCVQDPGNVGTVLRTADAFGMDAVYLLGACADVYNPKTVRATMGSLFRVPVIRTEAQRFLEDMKNAQIPVYAAALTENAKPLQDFDYTRAAVVIGNEGAGVSQELLEKSDYQIIIPMRGQTESLNAAVAASVFMWEMSRCP